MQHGQLWHVDNCGSKTHPFTTERLLMGRKESNKTNKQNKLTF